MALSATAAFAAGESHAKLFENSAHTVTCGVMIHAHGTAARWVLCSARGIPRASHGTGDPFVRIAATGKPQLVLLSQDSFVGATPKTLQNGARWNLIGVTCTIGPSNKVTCRNGSQHGFTIGNRRYKRF